MNSPCRIGDSWDALERREVPLLDFEDFGPTAATVSASPLLASSPPLDSRRRGCSSSLGRSTAGARQRSSSNRNSEASISSRGSRGRRAHRSPSGSGFWAGPGASDRQDLLDESRANPEARGCLIRLQDENFGVHVEGWEYTAPPAQMASKHVRGRELPLGKLAATVQQAARICEEELWQERELKGEQEREANDAQEERPHDEHASLDRPRAVRATRARPHCWDRVRACWLGGNGQTDGSERRTGLV